MANTDYKSVDQYIAAQPESIRPTLERVRAAIRKALPKAEEVISYQIPAYKIDGACIIYFAGWKEHFSLYPATGGLAEAFPKEMARYKVSKGTIKFPRSEPLPAKLIERIAKFRAKEEAERVKAKVAKKKRTVEKVR